MSAVAPSIFEERVDPGKVSSALLAAAMHVVLFLVLIFGVQWQNRPPDAVQVELWSEPVAAPSAPEPKPEPRVEAAPPPLVKPEPAIPKPEIAEKTAPPPKPAPKAEPKPLPKPEPAKESAKPRDEQAQRQIREQLAREQTALAIDRERQLLKDQAAREADTARQRGLADYEAKIRNKVRGNIVLPPDLQGNPEVVLLVAQLPTGEVLSVKLVKSSSHRGYDEAVERALLKSSPLPRPDRPELFSRELKLTFRPRD